MLSLIARNFIRLNLSLLFVLFLIGLNVLLVLSNYLACKISFELLGTENRPLGDDGLVGPFFRAFFSQASLAHLYAMLVAVTVSVGLFLVLKLAFETIQLVEDQRVYNENGDGQSARIAMRRVLHNLIMMAIFAVPLGFAIYWDINLFRFRSIAQVMGYEYPERVLTLITWSEQLRQYSDKWVWLLIKIGAWGYLAITALCCLGLEFAMYRAGEQWALLMDALSDLTEGVTSQELQSEAYGQDIQMAEMPGDSLRREPGRIPANTQNLHGPGPDSAPGRPENVGNSERVAADIPLQPGISLGPSEVAGGRNRASGGNATTPFAGGNGSDNNGSGQTNRPSDTLFNPADAAPTPGETASPSQRRETETTLQPVIGSANGERVSLAEALAHPEMYWVDPDTHEIWNVSYRGTLLG